MITIIHKTAADDFTGLLAEAQTYSGVVCVLITGGYFTAEQFMEIARLPNTIKWKLSKDEFITAFKKLTMVFKVTEILSTKIIRVEPQWFVKLNTGKGVTGEGVMIAGLEGMPMNSGIMDKLHNLLVGKIITITDSEIFNDTFLKGKVYVDGQDVANLIKFG